VDTLIGRIEYWASRFPEKTIFSFLDLHGNSIEDYSYESFWRRTNLVAAHLRHRHGFKPMDRVLLAYSPGLEIIVVFCGCVRAGLIPVPVAPPNAHSSQSDLRRMEHIARDCRPVAVLTDTHCRNLVKTANCGAPASDAGADYVTGLDWIDTGDFVEPCANDYSAPSTDILFLQYTSGSTSNPKGVMVSHDNILHNCNVVFDRPLRVGVSWLPQYHDMGLIGYYLFAILTGGTTYGFSPKTFIQRPSLWLETISKYRADASSAPNFAYDLCLRPGRISRETLDKLDLSPLRFLMAAAEPISSNTYRRFLQKFQQYGLKPDSFFVAYGLAENTLAVSNYGRTALSVNRKALARDLVRLTAGVADVGSATHLMSCGKPLGDQRVEIVDVARNVALGSDQIGEIWVSGRSKCLGYWNNPRLTAGVFGAQLAPTGRSASDREEQFVRTGDLGFCHDGELYVCGRLKDMIIVRGQNLYPQDIETIVEDASPLVRKGCVAAFETDKAGEAEIAIVAEASRSNALPSPMEIATAIRKHLNVEIGSVTFVAPKSIPKTSSGKIMRHMVKKMWRDGELKVLDDFSWTRAPEQAVQEIDNSPFGFIKARYNLSGNETCSLLQAGLDSIDLIGIIHEIVQFLENRGAHAVARQIDVRLIQQISIVELFRLADCFERSPGEAIRQVRETLKEIRSEHLAGETRMMQADRILRFEVSSCARETPANEGGGILLTGGTGFLGPFILKSLLDQTEDPVYVLIRAANEQKGRERIKSDLKACAPDHDVTNRIDRRIVAVCGDLSQANLGLTEAQWAFLANNIHTVYHNAATVNYLYNYERMRSTNVGGTNEILRLAFDSRRKSFNYISTTFIFGWAVKDVLYENDVNDDMARLDFGYSQSKWAAERVVADAARRGLTTRIFRPSFVTPSVAGHGNNLDITIRLLAFMAKHCIGINTRNQISFVPADIAANNIVAISNLSHTANGTFHVTTDDYFNIVDVTKILEKYKGRPFDLYSPQSFVPEVIKRCTKDDVLYPLLDFLVGSIDSITSMEFKRYDNSHYQKARDASFWGKKDVSIEETVGGILRFMERQSVI
jgi:thioester reductase-like protein